MQVLAHHIHILLTTFGVDSGELHGDLKQTDRVLTLKNFKDGKIDALVATDVAARGLDIAGVQTVSSDNFSLESLRNTFLCSGCIICKVSFRMLEDYMFDLSLCDFIYSTLG